VHDDVPGRPDRGVKRGPYSAPEPDRCTARPGGQGRRQQFRPGHGRLVPCRRRHRCHRSRPVPC